MAAARRAGGGQVPGAAGPGGSGRPAIQRRRRKARSLRALLPYSAVPMIASATASSITIAIRPILARLAGLAEACGQPDIDQIVAGARFAFANLVRAGDEPGQTNALYTRLLENCDPAWSAYAAILNNRGITWLDWARTTPRTAISLP